MRRSLNLFNVSIPDFPIAVSSAILEKVQLWEESDFAGYRRLITEGSDCYPDISKIKNLTESHRVGPTGQFIKHFVLLGTGGSSLGPEALVRALVPQSASVQFYFADNNDPKWFQWLLSGLNASETLFYVVSKSGRTPETISQFLIAKEWMQKGVGNAWKQNFVFCTDPASGDLRQLAIRWDIDCLDIASPVGGRFSVLSSVGLFPASFAGLKIEDLLAGANSVLLHEQQKEKNSIALLAQGLVSLLSQKPITVLMPYSSQLGPFSRWFCQLWAESLGKQGKGFTPYPAMGTTDQHSQMQLYMEGPPDKVIILLQIKSTDITLPIQVPLELQDLSAFKELADRSMSQLFDAEFRATRDALQNKGVSNLTLEIDQLDEYSMGALFYHFEWLTAFAGACLGVNPFDQPGVEAAKVLTKRYLSGLHG